MCIMIKAMLYYKFYCILEKWEAALIVITMKYLPQS